VLEDVHQLAQLVDVVDDAGSTPAERVRRACDDREATDRVDGVLDALDEVGLGERADRLVLVERIDTRSIEPESRRVTLPRRATSATVTFSPGNGTAVRTMRVNDQVRLHNDSGLRGTYRVDLTPYRTTRIAFQTPGGVRNGTVHVAYETPRTTKTTLSVTVDA